MAKELLKKLEKDIIKKRDFALVKSAVAGNKTSFAKLMSLYKTRVFILAKVFFTTRRTPKILCRMYSLKCL